MKIRLITEDYIKENSPVTYNNQMKDLYPHIDSAQDSYLRIILGSEFMDYLKIRFNLEDLSPKEIELVELYVQPALMWRTISLAIPFLHFNLRNKGFIMNNDDNGQPISLEELKFMLNEAQNRAEVLESLLYKYLCNNNDEYPKYKDQQGLTQPSGSDSFNTGLVFY